MSLTAEELRELRRLHLSAGRKVNSLFAGDYRSAVRGQGMEFEDIREYYPGDDVRHIDWNVTARTGQPFIKVFREERQRTVILLVDVSGSTRVGSGGRDGRTDRRLQIARIAGGMAYASIRNQDRIGLVTFSDRVEHFLTPRRTRGHAWAIIQHVYETMGNHRGTDIAELCRFVRQVQRRRAVLVLVSDFFDPGDWDTLYGSMARKHELHSILVTDPIDEGLRKLGLIEAVDAETGRTRLINGRSMRGLQTVEERLRRLRRAGSRAVAISTEDDAFAALHTYFQRQAGR